MIIDDNNANPVITIQSLCRMAELVNPAIKLLAKARINNMYTIINHLNANVFNRYLTQIHQHTSAHLTRNVINTSNSDDMSNPPYTFYI